MNNLLRRLTRLLDRTRSHQSTQETESHYLNLLDGIPVGLYRSTPAGRLLDVNLPLVHILGYPSREALLAVDTVDLYETPEARARWQELMEREGGVHDFEIQFRRHDDTFIWLRQSARTVRGKDGQVLCYEGVLEDITERKQAEEALRESEEKYRTILESIQDGYFEVDLAGNFTFFNDAMCRIVGYTRSEMMGMNNRQFMEPESAKQAFAVFNHVYTTGEPNQGFDWMLTGGDGARKFVEVSVSLIRSPNDEPFGFRGIARDVTERKQAEAEIRKLKEFNEGIVQSMAEGITVEDTEGYFTFVNPAAATLLGYDPEELVGQHWTIAVPPDQQAIVQAADGRRMRGQADRYEVVLVRKDGCRFSVLISGSPRFEGGRFVGTTAVFTDITDLKQAEKALHRYTERLRIQHEVDRAILAAQSPEEIVLAALERIRQLVPCQRASVSAFDFEADEATVLAALVNGDTQVEMGTRRPLKDFGLPEELRRGESWIVEDIENVSHSSPVAQRLLQEGIHSFLRVPLLAQDERIVTLNLGAAETGAFTAEHAEIAAELGDSLAVAIQNARLFQAEREQRELAETLREVVGALSTTLDRKQVLQLILEQLARVVDYDSASVLLVTDDEPDFAAHRGVRAESQLRNAPQIGTLDHVREILKRRVPMIISDTTTDPRWLLRPGSEYIRCWLGVPLVVQDQILGLLNLDKEEPNYYTERHAAIAQIFADQSAIAIANARLYEAARSRSRYLETLQQINATLRSTLPLNEVLETIARGTGQVLDYVGTIIAVPDARNERLRLGAAWGGRFLEAALRFTGRQVNLFSLPLTATENPVVQAYLTGELQAWSRAPEPIVKGVEPAINTQLAPLIKQAMGAQLAACIPLPAGQKIVGVLVVLSPREQLPDEEHSMLLGLAAQAGLAIENARLYEDLQNQMDELKQAQAQLIQSAKMAAVGQLAAGVAHELNNPLTSVLGFAELLLRGVPPDDPSQARLSIIASEARRARDIVRGLLDFARQSEFRQQPADVNQVVQETLDLIRRRLEKGGVILEEQYAADLPPLLLDVSRIKQVFLNLAVNALHAMPQGGTLTVTSEQVGDGVTVCMADTGVGIAKEHLPRIFEPFFTTKSVGEGTGLGLSISLGIVQDHRGSIKVESQKGKGSTFTVWLPVNL